MYAWGRRCQGLNDGVSIENTNVKKCGYDDCAVDQLYNE